MEFPPRMHRTVPEYHTEVMGATEPFVMEGLTVPIDPETTVQTHGMGRSRGMERENRFDEWQTRHGKFSTEGPG